MKRTTKYIVLILLLVVANLALLSNADTQRTSSFDDSLFTVGDTSEVTRVQIQYKDKEVEIRRDPGGWVLNSQYLVDENFRSVLFSILSRVKIKKSVGSWQEEVAGTVRVETNDVVQSFDFSSDLNKTKSYFISEGRAYEVQVPGYRDNVSDIFILAPDQWRSRLVFDGSWRTIQKLSLAYGGKSLTIGFNDQFFEVDNVNALDSSAVVDYLNQFQLFQANEMLSPGRFPALDSLAKTDPLAILRIDDIKSKDATTFKIYPSLDNQSYHLVTKNEKEMMVIGSQRISSILKSNRDFRLK